MDNFLGFMVEAAELKNVTDSVCDANVDFNIPIYGKLGSYLRDILKRNLCGDYSEDGKARFLMPCETNEKPVVLVTVIGMEPTDEFLTTVVRKSKELGNDAEIYVPQRKINDTIRYALGLDKQTEMFPFN